MISRLKVSPSIQYNTIKGSSSQRRKQPFLLQVRQTLQNKGYEHRPGCTECQFPFLFLVYIWKIRIRLERVGNGRKEGKAMLIVSGPSIIVRFQTQLALLFLLLSGGDNRSAKGGISYVLALMEGL